LKPYCILGLVGRGRGISGCRGIGGRCVGLDLRVGSNTLVGNISNIAVVVVSSVLHVLDPAIGKGNGVRSKDIAVSISRLSSVEGSLGVVILDSVLVGVGLPGLSVGRGRSIGGLGCIGSRGGNNNWDWIRDGDRGRGISWSRGIGRGRGICWGRRRGRKRSIGLRGIGRSGPVGAARMSAGHSHKSGQDKSLKKNHKFKTPKISVAESEPVEQQLSVGAGAKVFWPGPGSEYVNSYNMLQKALHFSY
jgi:hypothetical protein